MKKTLLLLLPLFAFVPAMAQHRFDAAEYNKRLGKIDTLCDKVYAVNIDSDTLTILAMGGKPPYQKFNILAKGYRVNMDFTTIKGKQVCIIGTFLRNKKGLPEITATRSDQIIVDTLPDKNK